MRVSHGIDPSGIAFVRGGEVAWSFNVGTPSGDFWLKVYADAEASIDARHAATAALCHEYGIEGVVCALKTLNGGFTFDVADFRASLFPYIDGVTWEQQPLTGAQQIELGQLLALVHSVNPAGFVLPVEDFDTSAADDAEAVMRALPDAANSDHPYRRAMAELLLPARDLLLAEIARLRSAAVTARALQARHVVCHGDPTDDNVIVSRGRVYLIDWDDLRLAPREFDLMHMTELPAAMAAYTASTGTAPDETLLDFYLAKWNNEEISGYAGRVLFQDFGDEQHQHDLDTMRDVVRELASGTTL